MPGAGSTGDVQVTASPAARQCIVQAIGASSGWLDDLTAPRCATSAEEPQGLVRITPSEAVSVICGLGEVSRRLGFTDDYRDRHGIDEAVMARHLLAIPAP